MSIFKTTPSGKCDVTVTLFNSNNRIVAQRSITFDVKPTIVELKERFKPLIKDYGAKLMRITTTPSCEVKMINL
jgi:hypothetical protein